MSRTRISIEGFESILKDKLHGLNKDGVIIHILKYASDVLIKRAKSLCSNTDVRNSIGFIERRKYHTVVLIGPDYRKGGNLAHIIEYGSGPRRPNYESKWASKNKYRKVKIHGEWRTMSVEKPFDGVPPKPFMRPAIAANMPKSEQIIQTELAKILLKAIDKTYKKVSV